MTRRLTSNAMAVLLAVAAIVAVTGCGGSDASGPPKIEYGRDMCAECHMIITDERFASAYRTAGGEERLFDDPGDLLAFGLDQDELDGADVWVHDFGSREWVEGEKAFYVVGADGVESPMGWGVVAYAAEEDAESFANDSRGRVVPWKDLVTLAESGELVPGGGHGVGPDTDGAGNQGGDE